jgi:hypothetical protein
VTLRSEGDAVKKSPFALANDGKSSGEPGFPDVADSNVVIGMVVVS